MNLLPIIEALEKGSGVHRASVVRAFLDQHGIPCTTHRYATGENLIVHINADAERPVVAVSSHTDVVPNSPGANDNASAIVVCLAVLLRAKTHVFSRFDLTVFFFDEEETFLQGSAAYLTEFGLGRIRALLNLELVGQGNQFALWPLDEQSAGPLLTAFETAAADAGIPARRFDRIITNSADHVSFREAGLADAFTVTCIGDADLTVAAAYYQAQAADRNMIVLQEILRQAPLFQHYHQPTDRSEHLSESTLQMTADSIWAALLLLDSTHP